MPDWDATETVSGVHSINGLVLGIQVVRDTQMYVFHLAASPSAVLGPFFWLVASFAHLAQVHEHVGLASEPHT